MRHLRRLEGCLTQGQPIYVDVPAGSTNRSRSIQEAINYARYDSAIEIDDRPSFSQLDISPAERLDPFVDRVRLPKIWFSEIQCLPLGENLSVPSVEPPSTTIVLDSG